LNNGKIILTTIGLTDTIAIMEIRRALIPRKHNGI
jgi:hypothetical protein